MFIVMQCGGMPFNGNTIKERSLGGSETAAYYVAKELAARGHHVTLFTNSKDEGTFDGVRYRWAGNLTEQTPMGERFHTYVVATPHDLCIIQRHPQAFQIPTAAKINAWWLHDMPVPQYRDLVAGQLHNTDLIFVVSEFHKEQVHKVWGIDRDIIVNVGNGIDLSLFDGEVVEELAVRRPDEFNLFYSSRPERGLETLVKPGGIMDRLQGLLPSAHLYVCGYDNVTEHMRGYYEYLNRRCDELPNVTRLGALTKKQLADAMRQCDLHVYPTIFEETSCITAMEAMAAGLPFLSSHHGALPETCDCSGSILLPLERAAHHRPGLKEAGSPDLVVNEERFADAIMQLAFAPHEERAMLVEAQLAGALTKTWGDVATRAISSVENLLLALSSQDAAVAKHLVRMSDIYALKKDAPPLGLSNKIEQAVHDELRECYAFTEHADWSGHYAKYYEYEKNRGVDYGPESLEGNHRFEYVASLVGLLPAGSTVLDYGCAHGHYTINLAKRFPALRFVGVDITESNVEKARRWAESEGLTDRVSFQTGQVRGGKLVAADGLEADPAALSVDLAIAAEVIEHVANPQAIVDALAKYVKDDGWIVTTTPYGPWEAMGYEEHWPWRAHVHHFERADLHDMFGMHRKFAVTVVSSGRTPQGENIGSYICRFMKPTEPCGQIDYSRKLRELAPRQTLSVCMIVKDSTDTIERCVKSFADIADELIVGLDPNSYSPDLREWVAHVWETHAKHKPCTVFVGQSPLDVGFDEARNATIDKASGEWIMWIDADEVLHNGQNLLKYLRHNQFKAYGIKQHHFSLEPAGVLKTDLPCRVFRNGRDVRFFGVVHEHPETGVNEGIGETLVLPDVAIGHYGYHDENVRQGRFSRNYPLLVRDRKKYPERTLGKFLWLRDLAQMTQWELSSGVPMSDAQLKRAYEGIAIWEDIVAQKNTRLAVESLEWYSFLVQLLGTGVPLEFAVGEQQVRGIFYSKVHVMQLFSILVGDE